MTNRKRTTAIHVRVTEQEKRKLERQAKRCGLSLSGYLRQAGSGKTVTVFPHQQLRALYQQVSVLRANLATQSTAQTAAGLDELASRLLTVYTTGDAADGDD